VHTATQLDASLFAVRMQGAAATREQLLPGWHEHDRFGIVVDSPLGAVGASLLLQLAVTAYYDARPSRREGPLYPDVYLFHVGSRHGDHAFFDVFPPRKEVDVPDDPAAILEAVNDRAITRLAVPDGPVRPARHRWKEPAAALERIVSAFAYSPTGRVSEPEVEITALDPRATANARMIIHPTRTYTQQAAIRARLEPISRVPPDEELAPRPSRVDEVSAVERERVGREREAIETDGLATETYRRIPVTDALGLLHAHPRPPWPASATS
jgi:hypothetical protein